MPGKARQFRPAHRKTERSRDERGSASSRGYGVAWRKLRLWFLADHPLCVECEAEGRIVPALHVDHVIAREKGGTDDDNNLQSLCASHHSKKTVERDGGLGRPRT